MKIYRGKRLGKREGLPDVEVTVIDGITGKAEPLKHRSHHSPTGFEWGYLGSGPADLARSILWDYFKEEPPGNIYMKFANQVVSKWEDIWEIKEIAVFAWFIKEFPNIAYPEINEETLEEKFSNSVNESLDFIFGKKVVDINPHLLEDVCYVTIELENGSHIDVGGSGNIWDEFFPIFEYRNNDQV